jgi:hypothetical protein
MMLIYGMFFLVIALFLWSIRKNSEIAVTQLMLIFELIRDSNKRTEDILKAAADIAEIKMLLKDHMSKGFVE